MSGQVDLTPKKWSRDTGERKRIEEMKQLPADAFPTIRRAAPLLETQMTDDHFTRGLRQILGAVTPPTN